MTTDYLFRHASEFEASMLTAAVSGSFHRHMEAITSAVHEMAALGVHVLSPADPRIVAAQGEFLFVASDVLRSVRLVQDRHLESIKAANFLWLVCPDGYVGPSASMEIGFAIREGVPIFATRQPLDLTMREYVRIAPSLSAAVKMIRAAGPTKRAAGILIDPHASIEQAHSVLDQVGGLLTHPSRNSASVRRVYGHLAELQTTLAVPAYTH